MNKGLWANNVKQTADKNMSKTTAVNQSTAALKKRWQQIVIKISEKCCFPSVWTTGIYSLALILRPLSRTVWNIWLWSALNYIQKDSSVWKSFRHVQGSSCQVSKWNLPSLANFSRLVNLGRRAFIKTKQNTVYAFVKTAKSISIQSGCIFLHVMWTAQCVPRVVSQNPLQCFEHKMIVDQTEDPFSPVTSFAQWPAGCPKGKHTSHA